METKLKIDKKTNTYKLPLPDGCGCVIICLVTVAGLKPLHIELGTNVRVDYIDKLLEDPDVTQITLIPINFTTYIPVLKEWRPVKCATLKEFQ